MMTLTKKLTWLLVIQAILIICVGLMKSSSLENKEKLPWLAVNKSNIDRIVIANADNKTTLKKQGTTWKLANLHNLPADAVKIERVLNQLDNIKVRWPVTTSKASHERFEVSNDKFQREVTLYQGENELTKFYLGSSPNFRKVHARLATQNDVYAIDFNTYDLPVEDNDWLNKSLLAIKEIDKISTAKTRLTKTDGTWALSNLVDNNQASVQANNQSNNQNNDQGNDQQSKPEVNQDKVNTFAENISSLTVLNIADSSIELIKDEGKDNRTQFDVRSPIGGENHFELFSYNDEQYLKTSNFPYTFKITDNQFNQLTQLNFYKEATKTTNTKEQKE